MTKIIIEIPDDLSKHEEVLHIAKALAEHKLLGGAKLLGDGGVMIKDLKDTIEVRRVSAEKLEITCDCMVCDTTFMKKLGKKFYTNYGGTIKSHMVCSTQCRREIVQFLGTRASVNRNFKPVWQRD